MRRKTRSGSSSRPARRFPPPLASSSRRSEPMPNWTTHGQWQTRANACKGEYRPVVYRVRVDDEFAQWRYRLATTALWGQSVRVEEFLWLCAEYVIRHHRQLAAVRREIR